jgi:hypothetical protein
VAHLAAQLGAAAPQAWADEVRRTKSLYRYQALVRTYLSVTAYDDAAKRLVAGTVLNAAATMSDPADLINRAVEALETAAFDLPAFSTLNRLVNRLRVEVHGRMYARVAACVSAEQASLLDALLIKLPESAVTGFNRLKQVPGPAMNRAGFAGGCLVCVTLPWRVLRVGRNSAPLLRREACFRSARATAGD